MPSKTKDTSDKVAVMKGKEAEDAILKYLNMMNRPFGAIDVCANLKGAVPKASTQKILMSLAEKGEITQKVCGKSVYFVAKQANLEDMPPEKLKELEKEHKSIEEENKLLAVEVRTATNELTKIRNTPTDDAVSSQIEETAKSVEKVLAYLLPLRAGVSLVSPEEISQLDADWIKWRAEWISRRKVFTNLWHLVTDSLPPQEAKDLAEELGVENDTAEHAEVERGPLCTTAQKRR